MIRSLRLLAAGRALVGYAPSLFADTVSNRFSRRNLLKLSVSKTLACVNSCSKLYEVD